jgi:hypothetical protein
MKKPTFPFDPELWMSDKRLRACSPAARGFWVDLLCLCFPSGVLPVLTDVQLSRLIGEPTGKIKAWLKELGEAGIFHISDDEMPRLFSSRMVKHAAFVAAARKSGAKGAARKSGAKGAARKSAHGGVDPSDVKVTIAEVPPPVPVAAPVPSPVVPRKPVARALDWWLTPAGWVRQGGQQGISMASGEAFEDFQVRVAVRVVQPSAAGPDNKIVMLEGPWMDVLSPTQRRMVDAMRPKQ